MGSKVSEEDSVSVSMGGKKIISEEDRQLLCSYWVEGDGLG